MINSLNIKPALISVALTALLSGCASAPAPQTRAPATSAGTEKADGNTQFDQQTVDDTLREDFWDTGATASVDDNGRLVYVVPTEVVADGNVNNDERISYEGGNATYYYLDPVTGLPVLVPANTWPGSNRGGIRVRTSGQSPQRIGPTRAVSPTVTMPRSAPRAAPAPAGTRSMSRDRR